MPLKFDPRTAREGEKARRIKDGDMIYVESKISKKTKLRPLFPNLGLKPQKAQAMRQSTELGQEPFHGPGFQKTGQTQTGGQRTVAEGQAQGQTSLNGHLQFQNQPSVSVERRGTGAHPTHRQTAQTPQTPRLDRLPPKGHERLLFLPQHKETPP